MRKKYNFIFFVLFISFFLSCEDENQKVVVKTESILLNKIEVKNERLYFPNKTTFQDFYNSLKNKKENETAEILEKQFYSKGFYSLKPIVNENTEFEIENHLKKFRENLSLNQSVTNRTMTIGEGVIVDDYDDEIILDHYDDLEEVIGEDVFASLLNSDAEVQVGDVIYKYTDSGLLMANIDYVDEIYKFMKTNNVNSLSNFYKIKKNNKYPKFNLNGGLKSVNKHVNSYLAERVQAIDPEYGGGGGTTQPIETTYIPTTISNLNTTIDGLGVCTPSSPWVGNMFGTTKVCIDKYESNRRVKLKYYSVDFFLAFSIGVKVKHQFKGWTGIWRQEDSDEIALGINSVTWFFDHSKIFANTSNNMIVNYYTTDNGKLYKSINSYNNAIYVGQDKPIPSLPIKNLDIVIEVATNTIGAELTEYQIRKLFWNQIYDQAKKIMTSLNKNMNEVGVIINQNGRTVIQYYNLSTRCNNCSKQEKVFDWGIVTPKMTYTFGADSGGDFNVNYGFKDLTFDFKHPNVTGLNMYGMVKRNGNWHGFKMVF